MTTIFEAIFMFLDEDGIQVALDNPRGTWILWIEGAENSQYRQWTI